MFDVCWTLQKIRRGLWTLSYFPEENWCLSFQVSALPDSTLAPLWWPAAKPRGSLLGAPAVLSTGLLLSSLSWHSSELARAWINCVFCASLVLGSALWGFLLPSFALCCHFFSSVFCAVFLLYHVSVALEFHSLIITVFIFVSFTRFSFEVPGHL